jgi:hypothetical protein
VDILDFIYGEMRVAHRLHSGALCLRWMGGTIHIHDTTITSRTDGARGFSGILPTHGP